MTKKSGSYYTPIDLSDFVVRHLHDSALEGQDGLAVLEPSSGGGAFIDSCRRILGGLAKTLDAVELDPEAIKESRLVASMYDIPTRVYCSDYLEWCQKYTKRYDVIIGNPPYITKRLLEAEQRTRCRQIQERATGSESGVYNIWPSFLFDAIFRLSDNGVLGFVLPAELLKVKFGIAIQKLLLTEFRRVEVITFSEQVFNNISQDTIVLFLYKQSDSPGLFFGNVDDKSKLNENSLKLSRRKGLEKESVKWSSYLLSDRRLSSLAMLRGDLLAVGEYCDTTPGLVTAANDYFIVSEETLDKYELRKISRPIIQKGQFVNGSVRLTESNFRAFSSTGKPSYFIDFSKSSESVALHKEYIKKGEKERINERYKCRKRDPWFELTDVSTSKGIFFKRCHEYPKFVYNEAEVLVTDSAYRVYMKPGFDIKSLIFSFYNSMTLAYAEMMGRYYGGGVLELTPSEFRALPIPYIKVSDRVFNRFAKQFESKSSISEILQINDEIILKEAQGYSTKEVEFVSKVREQFFDRRVSIS